jgi:hypothetical protein
MTATRAMRRPESQSSGRLSLEGLEEKAFLHIVSVQHTTLTLARATSTSVPTMARALARLRRSLQGAGMELASVRVAQGYHYEIRGLEEYVRRHWRASRLRSLAGSVKEGREIPWKREDQIIYGKG